MTSEQTKVIIKSKRELQIKIQALINKFHEQNPGFEVYTCVPFNTVYRNAENDESGVVCDRVSCTIKLATE